MHVAVANRHTDVVRALLAAGADPALRDDRFDSDTLGWATHFGYEEIAALLRG